MKTKKKNRKNLGKSKILKKKKKKKNVPEIYRIGSFPQTLACIPAAVSEKHELTDGRWMTDACATTVALLLTKSSRAKNPQRLTPNDI